MSNIVFKQYTNAEIAASAFWDVTPVENNDRPIAKHAPFVACQIQNNSDYDIEVKLNGSENRAVYVYAGCVVVMSNHKFDWLRVLNTDGSNAIAANLVDIQIGAKMSFA